MKNMTKHISIHSITFIGILLIIWSFLFFLSVNNLNPFELLNVVGFLFLIIIPGFLTYRTFQLPARGFWAGIGLSICISLLELMFMGLIINTLLPHFGVTAPLEKNSLLVSLSLLLGVLMTAFYLRVPLITCSLKRYVFFAKGNELLFGFTPILFVILSILGAIRLNNWSGNILTLIFLIGVGIYIVFAIRELLRNDSMDTNVIPTAIFFLSLALLFMISLRGWYTTGHDVQLEYRVFELTHSGGIWLINNFKDAYNACMSITILPTIFATLLHIPSEYVYKVLFQLLFATVPVMVYLSVRQYVGVLIAFIATLYFIAFPTFFGDMPMLNRQEIAFLFLSTMIHVLFDDTLSLQARHRLFSLLGIGMILSHYSTTYTVIALLLFVLITRPIIRVFQKKITKHYFFKNSGISELNTIEKPHILITYTITVILLLGSFLWSSMLTDTSSGSLTRVILKTLTVIKQNSKEDARSSDVFYSLFTWGKPDPSKAIENYEKKFVEPTRAKHPEKYYPQSIFDEYKIHAAPDKLIPLTILGRALEKSGMSVKNFNYIFRQSTARILQLLIIIGFVYILFRNRFFQKKWEFDYALLALGSLLMVASQVLLPVLSAEYGVLRAFQQSLMFLGILVVIGSLVLVSKLKEKNRIWFATVILIVFFYSTTGVFTQILGGYPAQLHLANEGSYFNNYYTHKEELSAIDWLAQDSKKRPGATIQTDRFEYQLLHTIGDANISKGIFPMLIEKNAYVFLGYANTMNNTSAVSWNSDAVTYIYPISFLDEQKDLLYNNGKAKIYK